MSKYLHKNIIKNWYHIIHIKMSTTLSVCGSCRDTCPKCQSTVKSSQAHPIWSCNQCKKSFGSKCCVCGEPKSGGVGSGSVCKSCFKVNTCTFCGKHN